MKPESDAPSVLLAMQRTTHATLHLLATELADLDLTAAEINAVANLADSHGRGHGRGHGRTVSELGAATGRRPTTLTSVLDRLERRGHITRGARAGDRRAVLIELTASGRRVAKTIEQSLTEIESNALSDVGRSQLAGFHTVVDALTKVAR